ncbi:MAG: PQQ-binding-like beta-propeller repeat protein [Isosphaeraceae bacterium]
MNRVEPIRSFPFPKGGSRWRPRLSLLACAFAFLCLGGHAAAQGTNRAGPTFYADFSDTADALLRNAANLAAGRQWEESVDIYQRVIREFADKVAKLPKDDPAADPSGDSQLYVDLRHYCQRRLASLPPQARAIYRRRVDAEAERWFRQGARTRDLSLLRRVVDEHFCSSWGDDVAELLGDLAFQDGRFDEALSSYRRLVADGSGAGSGLIHPDPDVDLARVAAKKILARAAAGHEVPGKDAIDALARAYPNASGELAGREGPYAEIVADCLRADGLIPASEPDGRWPTFAGSPTRTRVMPSAIDVGSIQWRVDLDPITPTRSSPRPRGIVLGNGPTSPDQRLGYHPIIIGDQVIVCDESRITAFNLNDRPTSVEGATTGGVKIAWRHDENVGSDPQAARFTFALPRYTLTAHGDRIYARMGTNAVPYMTRTGGSSGSYLVAVDRATDGKLLWKKLASDTMNLARAVGRGSRSVGFEGTPVADARNVYVALTDRREQTTTFVACLDAETGATRWVRYLGAASTDDANMAGMGMGMGMGMGGVPVGDYGHRLLSLDGPTLYFQTNLGAVAALDAESGSVRWVATYPRVEANGSERDRDLNPAIVHDGLVIVAPNDASSIYAFDAINGRLAWKTGTLPDDLKLAHLLGVARGRLVATGDRVLLFDVKDGKLVHTWPDAGRGFEAYGRGLLAGDKIYWPTRTEIHVLDQSNGLRFDPPIRLQETFQTTGGNLAAGDGYLVVAQAEQLVVFCQNRRLIQRYREEIARTPDDATLYYRMARAAEAAGQDDLALEASEQAVERARPSQSLDGRPLLDAARDQKYRLLVKLGDRARDAADFAKAEDHYRSAAETARIDRDRLKARLAESNAQLRRGSASRAVATLQALLQDDRLRGLTVETDESRRSLRSDLLIGDRLAEIVKAHGKSVYAEFDQEARSLLSAGKTEANAVKIEAVARLYPSSEVVSDSLLALARLHETEHRPQEAVRAFKRLLAFATTRTQKGIALLGMAQGYEAQELWVPSHEAYLRALAGYPDVTLGDPDRGDEVRLGTLVLHRLGASPFDRMIAEAGGGGLPIPLARLGKKTLEDSVRPLKAEGVPPSGDATRVYLARGNALLPAGLDSERANWRADLGATPIWVGYLEDRIVAATSARVEALGLRDGKSLWRYETGPSGSAKAAANPFVRPSEPGNAREAPGPLHGFRIVEGRVVLLRGKEELLALDGETGMVDWSFRPPTGELNPHLWVDVDRVILQSLRPNALIVLETATGRRRAEYPLPVSQEGWERDPLLLDDDRVALVEDRRTVAVFDLARGVKAWEFRESPEMPRFGPPRLLGDAERLLLVHDGTELIRLDQATGLRRWSRPLGTKDLSERPEAFGVDGTRVYWISGQTLSAASLADGVLAWSSYLSGPSSGWSIDLAGRNLLAYPGGPRPPGEELEGLPLVVRRTSDGGLVQRLRLPATVAESAVRFSPKGAIVVTQSGLWALGPRAAVDDRALGR